jgi:hypothetical protein
VAVGVQPRRGLSFETLVGQTGQNANLGGKAFHRRRTLSRTH